MNQPQPSNNKRMWLGLAIASWPIAFGVLYLTASKPGAGQRWADANPGRGSFLAATGFIWMTALLLVSVWKFTFSLVVPRLIERRERNESKVRNS